MNKEKGNGLIIDRYPDHTWIKMNLLESLKNPAFFEENRLKPHSDHIAYAPGDEKDSSLRKMLNGEWLFHYTENLSALPEGFEQPEYDCSQWDRISVPGHIQLQGYDKPQYVNVQYPWDGHEQIGPGEIPVDFNPSMNYVCYFTVPDHFTGKRIFISFQGVESSFRLWLNGHYVGFSSDSFTPSEFELTPYLVSGENKLAVQVYKWYSGSWLEDQDFFRFSGIFRDVYLYAAPEHHVIDVKIVGDYDPEHPETGSVDVTLTCLNAGGRVQLELFSAEGHLIDDKAVTMNNDPSVQISFSVSHPILWSAECPYLYHLRVTVSNGSSDEEWFEEPIGIRHFELDQTIMKLNGKRIVFRGVNRHEFSTDNGRTVSVEELRKDLYTMKRNNINAIRLSHYPNSSAIYRMADELGFYLIDECNMESHGSWELVERGILPVSHIVPGDHMEYQDMLLDRIHSMYERDKNHPCILIWSLGNESFGGPVIHQMSQELKRLDPTRLIHYEGIFHDRRFPDTSDMESQMYTPASRVKDYLSVHRDKPFILCEHSHAMGNSCGALYKYTDLAETEALYQGGFIWDYIDQALRKTDRYGREYFAYGGDHDDRPHDGNFSGDGLVDGDRNPTPKMQEVKYCYQDLKIQVERDAFYVKNLSLFTNTDQYRCIVRLDQEGYFVKEVSVDTQVAPQAEVCYALPFPLPAEPGEYCVTVSFVLKESSVWADAGYEIAFGQGIFRNQEVFAPEEPCGPGQLISTQQKDQVPVEPCKPVKMILGDYNIGVQGEGFEVLFSRMYGGMVSYRYHGKEMLSSQVRPNFWRALTDNDKGNLLGFRCGQWKTASLYADHKNILDIGSFLRFENPVAEERDGKAYIRFTYYLPTVPFHCCTLSYIVSGDGTVQADLKYDPPAEGQLPDLPEFSVMFKMNANYHQIKWYGLGPMDCYCDRDKGARLGIFSTQTEKTLANYLVPQESGNHTRVRWLELTDDNGNGLRFLCNELDVNVSPYSPHELEEAQHPTELPPVHYTYVRIGQQMGVGGDDSWGSMTHEEYLIRSNISHHIHFSFRGI